MDFDFQRHLKCAFAWLNVDFGFVVVVVVVVVVLCLSMSFHELLLPFISHADSSGKGTKKMFDQSVCLQKNLHRLMMMICE